MINFRSDNASGVAPQILDALHAANHSTLRGYGGDEHSARAGDAIRERFEAPEAEVFFVASGTAANAIALGASTNPGQVIYCHEHAHIYAEEAGAPEFYSYGAKLKGIPHTRGKLDPSALQAAIGSTESAATGHMPAGAISITNVTEFGALYRSAETAPIGRIAKAANIPFHVDGARFAGAVAATGESPAALSHKAGASILSLGGTKNGGMNVEAIVAFDPLIAERIARLQKRGGATLSKGQYLGVQFEAFMNDDLWLTLAHHANTMAAELASGMEARGIQVENHPEANLFFASFPRALHHKLKAAGVIYYLEPGSQSEEGAADELLRARFVTSWASTIEEVNKFLTFL